MPIGIFVKPMKFSILYKIPSSASRVISGRWLIRLLYFPIADECLVRVNSFSRLVAFFGISTRRGVGLNKALLVKRC